MQRVMASGTERGPGHRGWLVMRCSGAISALARLVALCCAIGLAQPAAAQERPGRSIMAFPGLGSGCGDKLCPPPSDPLTRDTLVLRMLPGGLLPNTALPGGGGFGGTMSIAEWNRMQAEAREQQKTSPAALLSLGMSEAFAGRFAAAQPILRQAQERSVVTQDARAEAASLNNLAVVAAMLGQYDQARSLMEQSWQVVERFMLAPRLPPGMANAPMPALLPGIPLPPAMAAKARGQYAALQLALEALSMRSAGVFVQLNLGSLAAHLGQPAQAEIHLAKARDSARAGQAAVQKQPGEDRHLGTMAMVNSDLRTVLAESELFYRVFGGPAKAATAAQYRQQARALAPKRSKRDDDEDDDDESEANGLRMMAQGPELALTTPVAAPGTAGLVPAAPEPSRAVATPEPARALALPEIPAPPAAAAEAPDRGVGGRLKRQIERLVARAAERQLAKEMPSYAACAGGRCAEPADPATRNHHVLRLANVVQNPALGAERAGSPALRNATGIGLAGKGQLDAARAEWEQAQSAGSGGRSALVEAVATQNLGVAAALQGRPGEARARLQTAHAALGKLAAAGAAAPLPMPTPGAVGALAGMQVQAIAGMMEQDSASAAQLLVALNLANLEAQLGRHADSDTWARRALAQAMADGSDSQLVLGEMAVLLRLRGQADAAADHLHRARAGSETRDVWSQVAMGFLVLGAVAAPSPPAAAGPAPQAPARASAAPAAAPVAAPQTAANAEAAQLRALQATDPEPQLTRLAAQALAQERAGDRAAAIAAHGRAALMAAATGNGNREREALASLQRLHAAAGAWEAAIFQGKRAVNATQQLRKGIEQLDRAARQNFLADRKQAYSLLARTLMDRDRLPEAEQALRLLKEDEGQQQLDARRSRGAMVFSVDEQAALQARDQLLERLRPLQDKLSRLTSGLTIDGALDTRAGIESARLKNLNRSDQSLGTMEANLPKETASAAATCQRINALAPAARKAADAEQLVECTLQLRAVAGLLSDGAQAVRQLQQDSARFLRPPTPAEQRQMAALLARFAALQARLQPALAQAGAPGAGGQSAPALVFNAADFVFDAGHLHEAWSLQIAIDALAEQADGLEAGLDKALAGRRALEFNPAARTALDATQRLLRALPAGTVAVYYLGGEQRLDMLVVTAAGWSKAQSAVPSADLDRRITAYRAMLEKPVGDPLADARALHGVLIAPILPALEAARATTLMLALEGPLRYLPFAALHDGSAWLAERYATSLYTTAAPTALTAVPSANWRVAAFGNSVGGAGLTALPAVRSELEAIVRDPAQRSDGLMPGDIHLNQQFTAQALRDALKKRPQLVHIASHFKLKSDAPFLLLGDGNRLTLAQMAGADFRFDQVELVTLSACETALVAGNSFGQELEAMGTLLQAQGAAAVLSTLWEVADDSTARLMRRFYGAREGRLGGVADHAQPVSKARALQLAQLEFIRPGAAGTAALAAAAPDSDGGQTRGARLVGRPGLQPHADRPHAHPFYWAPFVLMGNWR